MVYDYCCLFYDLKVTINVLKGSRRTLSTHDETTLFFPHLPPSPRTPGSSKPLSNLFSCSSQSFWKWELGTDADFKSLLTITLPCFWNPPYLPTLWLSASLLPRTQALWEIRWYTHIHVCMVYGASRSNISRFALPPFTPLRYFPMKTGRPVKREF